jgi:cytochrome c
MHRILFAAALLAAMPAFAEDAAHGQAVFQRTCSSCHQVTQPRNMVGPHLIGVVGRKIGGVEGFAYSPALKAAQGEWTAAALDAYLTNPSQAYKGTKMLNRVTNETDRMDLIAYLATVK